MNETAVKEFIKEKRLFTSGDRVIVAVSGGPDSLCLLHLLLKIRKELNIEIYVAHLNHLFRKESFSEFEDVRLLVHKWKLPFYGARINVPEYRDKKKISSQMAARECRYKFLLRAASFYDANVIATGHHNDDQAETVIMNILSGTGLKGLSGISSKQVIKGIKLVRPLLTVSRDEIIDYCKKYSINYIDDSSNLNDHYRRNKVRLNLLPYLKREFNPNISGTLTRMSELVRADNDYLNKVARKMILKYTHRQIDGSLFLDLTQLNNYHLSLKRRVVKEAWNIITSGKSGYLSALQTDSVIKLWEKGVSGKSVTLPGNAVARMVYNGMILSTENNDVKNYSFNELTLEVPGITYLGDLPYYFESIITKKENLKWPLDESKEAYFDLGNLTFPLKARKRCAGDYLLPLGMNGRKKKLKDLFSDKKIEKSERDLYPILLSGKDIIWVTGLAVSEKYCITENTEQALIVRFCEKILAGEG